MLGEIFYWLLNMSISAVIVGTIVFLIGKIKRLPRKITCFLWVVPFVRMVLPFGIGSRFSLMTLLSQFTAKTVSLWEEAPDFSMTNYVMAAESYFPITYKNNALEAVFSTASVIWLIVACAMLLAFGILYFLTLAELRDAVHLRENLYLSDKVTSAAVYGVFRPIIILPAAYREADLPYILAHEKMHIRRADNLRRLIAFAVTAVHWFNPLAWLFLRDYLTQTELACDEGVLAGLDAEERKKYALTLVNAASRRDIFASAFGGARVRVRIEAILSYKKLSLLTACSFAVLTAAVVITLLTNAA